MSFEFKPEDFEVPVNALVSNGAQRCADIANAKLKEWIQGATLSYGDPSKAEHLIKSISTQASLGLELATPMSAYRSDAEFFAAEAAASSNSNREESLPSGKTELKDGYFKLSTEDKDNLDCEREGAEP